MIDMIAPADMTAITIKDLIKPEKRHISGRYSCSKQWVIADLLFFSGVLFDVLFNLHKFMRFETRDPFQEKLRREDMFHSDWDRFAHIEYNRLAQEEEGYDASMEVDAGNGNGVQSQDSGAGGGGSGGQGGGGFNVEQLNTWSLNDDDDEDGTSEDITGDHIIDDDLDEEYHDTSSGGGGGGSWTNSGSGSKRK